MKNKIYITIIFTVILTVLKYINEYHVRNINEYFIEQTRFAGVLLKDNSSLYKDDDMIISESKEKLSTKEKDVLRTDSSCDCPVTKYTTLKVDNIGADKRDHVSFTDKVIMDNVLIKDSLRVNQQEFLKYDTASRKITIG
tara:strand:+ start:346 stop:765 length:420 start_codon:yes stop_codon:yes gene_type:complete